MSLLLLHGTCFGHGDGLLFHGLVHGRLVVAPDRGELLDVPRLELPSPLSDI